MSIIIKRSDNEYHCQNESGKTLLELIQKQGIAMNASCGGKGTCGCCKVNLLEGQFLKDNQTIHISKGKPVSALACMTTCIHEYAVVEVPETSLIIDNGKVVDEFLATDSIIAKHMNPVVKRISLEIPPAVLGVYDSDQQRFEKALAEQIHDRPVKMSLSILKKLPKVLAEDQGMITVLVSSFQDSHCILDVVSGESDIVPYGLAIDIGTTTVAGWLIDLESGKILSKSSLYNQQVTLAEDVISRISLIQTEKEIETLQKLLIDQTIHPILSELCDDVSIDPDKVLCAVFSGNTVMTHLLLGLDPRGIGKAPFNPVIKHFDGILAKEIGVPIYHNGLIFVAPAVSGYVGGDIVSDIYVSKFNDANDLRLLIDIGTNGEMVLCKKGKMVACSTAAGPAFEGYGLYHGCRAGLGAIERIQFDENENLQIQVIGGRKASGLCGSAIIDFIAVFLQKGFILPNGRFDVSQLQKLGLHSELQIDGNKCHACIVADYEKSARDEPIVVTEADVAKILQAKAAIYAGIRVLLEKQKKTWQDLDQLVLAGGFAQYIDPAHAIAIGLLPDIPLDRIDNIGNGSLAGAYYALMNVSGMQKMNDISNKIDVIELNMVPSFQAHYIGAMWLPGQS